MTELKAMGYIDQRIDKNDKRQKPRTISFISREGLILCNETMDDFMRYQTSRMTKILWEKNYNA